MLKPLNNAIVTDNIICCAVNLNITEYILRSVFIYGACSHKTALIVPGDDISFRFCIDSKVVGLALKTIVETKIFVKEWTYVLVCYGELFGEA